MKTKYMIYDEDAKNYWRFISESKLYRLFTVADGTFENEKAFDEYNGDFWSFKHDLKRCGLLRVVNA